MLNINFNKIPKQKIRLFSSLVALFGGIFFGLVLAVGFYYDLLQLPIAVFYLLMLQLVGNTIFIFLITTNINLRFQEQSLTLPQMIWAAASLSPLPYLAPTLINLFPMLNLLILSFGLFTLRPLQFIIFVILMSCNHLTNILIINPGENLYANLSIWLLFTYFAVSFNLINIVILFLKKETKRLKDNLDNAVSTKNQFLANMSHEIRTPMNAISGMAILLLNSTLDDEQQEYARTIDTSTQALLDIVNNILDYSKIQEGRLTVTEAPFNIQALANQIMETHGVSARGKNLLLELDIAVNTPADLLGDELRIRQILNHFINNSIKFTYSGWIILKISVLAKGTDEANIEFAVIDSGIGISPENQRNLFSQFNDLDKTANLFDRSGIGLEICKKLAKLMGGTVGVESVTDGGSRFWFEMNLSLNQALENFNADSDSQLTGLSAIVCQTAKHSVEITSKLLAHWGLKVSSCRTGAEAIEFHKTAVHQGKPPDFLLLSDNLNDMNIDDIAAAIQSFSAKTRLIVLPHYPKRGDRRYYQGLGAHGYLPSPTRGDILENLLINTLLIDPENHSLITRYSSEVDPPRQRFQDCKPVKANLLLVEDNVVNQRVAIAFLKKFGCRVDIADNGELAVQQFQKKHYDLILADCQMPVVDGYEMARRIRIIESDTRRIPIIAVTAHNTEAEREKCLKAGMDDYITKPITKDTLYRALAKYCPS